MKVNEKDRKRERESEKTTTTHIVLIELNLDLMVKFYTKTRSCNFQEHCEQKKREFLRICEEI